MVLQRIVSSSYTMSVENPGARREEQCGKWPVGCVLRLNAEISSNQSRNDVAAVIRDRTSRVMCLPRSTLKGFWLGAEASRRRDPTFDCDFRIRRTSRSRPRFCASPPGFTSSQRLTWRTNDRVCKRIRETIVIPIVHVQFVRRQELAEAEML